EPYRFPCRSQLYLKGTTPTRLVQMPMLPAATNTKEICYACRNPYPLTQARNQKIHKGIQWRRKKIVPISQLFQQLVTVIETRNGLITRLQAYPPYGPPGIGGLLVRLTRLVWRLQGKRK